MPQVDPFELRKFRLLDSMPEDDLSEMVKHLRRARFCAETRICLEEPGDRCFFLMSGRVLVSKDLQDGRFLHLAVLPEGSIFGQAGLIEGQKRSAQVSAQTEVQVLSLERSTFDWALSRKMSWAIALQQVIAISLIQQLRSATERFEVIAGTDEEYRKQLIEGELIEVTREKPVYMNFSDSFTALPAFSPNKSPNEENEESSGEHQEHDDFMELMQISGMSSEKSGGEKDGKG